ncbi:histone acetylation protein-domain-containing protein [Blakeslea trispora]|nr:histone acetylation protein-domain-containing protein [Blakeslea trispora]
MLFETSLKASLKHFAPDSTFEIYNINSSYTKCSDALIKQFKGETYVRHCLILVSVEEEGLLCGLETYHYKLKEEKEPTKNIIYISKVDTATTLEKYKGLTARIVQSYISSLPNNSSIFVFARAQPQYLFAKSADNKSKKTLNDRDLVYWWLSVLNKVVRDDTSSIEGWWSIPGIDDSNSALIEIGARKRGWKPAEHIQWRYGTSYSPEAEARLVIPRFDDDAKTRLLKSVQEEMSVSDFWNLLSIGEECGSGKVSGFFELRLKKNEKENPEHASDASETRQTELKGSDFIVFWNKLMSLDFHDQKSRKSSTEAVKNEISQVTPIVIRSSPAPTSSTVDAKPSIDKRPAVNMLSCGLIKRKKI